MFFVFVNKLNWAIKVGWQPDQDQEIPCDLNRSVLHVVALPIGFSQACYGGLGQTLGPQVSKLTLKYGLGT